MNLTREGNRLPMPRLLLIAGLLAAALLPEAAAQPAYGQPTRIAEPAEREVFLGSRQQWSLASIFRLQGVTHRIVQFDTNLGFINVELLEGAAPSGAPGTVANFLSYVESGRYTNTFFHRSVPGFVVQTGGFTVNGNQASGFANLGSITTNAPIANEFSATRSNLKGTLAMAKLGSSPDSATSQFFWNLEDNAANLDTQNGGFTVFARTLTPSFTIVEAVAGLTRYNASGFGGFPAEIRGALGELPLLNDSGSAASFATIRSAQVVPVFRDSPSGPGVLRVTQNAPTEDFAAVTVIGGVLSVTPISTGAKSFGVVVADTLDITDSAEIKLQVSRLIGDETTVSGNTVTSPSLGAYSAAAAPWLRSETLGWFYSTPRFAPFVFQEQLGWMYLRSASGGSRAFITAANLGWTYIPLGRFPTVYSYARSRWLHIDLSASTTNRIVAWDHRVNGWIVITP